MTRINNASNEAQITFFLWLLAIVNIAGVGAICLIMAPPSTSTTVVGWSLIVSGVVVTQSRQVARACAQCWTRWSPTINRLFRISPDPDESVDALEVFGAAYVRDLPRIISG